MNKKKNLKKRILALLGILVILVGVIMVPVGALSITDIPFYNYFNSGLVKATYNNGVQAYIINADTDGGYIDMEFITRSNVSSYYVPSSYVNRTFEEFAPALELGKTYYLNCEYAVTNDNFIGASYLSLRHPVTDEETRIYYGKPFLVTRDILDSRPLFFAGIQKTGAQVEPDLKVNAELKLWCNETPDQPFASYNLAKQLFGSAYEQGRMDGIAEFTRLTSIFSKEYVSSVKMAWYSDDGDSIPDTVYVPPNIELVGNGYSFTTLNIPAEYYRPPIALYPGSKLMTVAITFDLSKLEEPYVMGSTPFYLTAKGCDVWIECIYGDYAGYSTYSFSPTNGALTREISRELLSPHSYHLTQIILHINMWGRDNGTIYDPAFYASMSIAEAGGTDYVLGYDRGSADGYKLGKDEGYIDGKRDGDDEGYTRGLDEGKLAGEKTGFSKGYDSAWEKAKIRFLAEGEDIGFYKGLAEGQKSFKFVDMIASLVDVPVNAFRNLFNFNVLGVDMSSFALSLITVALCITIIKKVI